MENAIIALTFGFLIILIVLPILALTILTVLDAIFRVDIDISKFVWLGLVMFVPFAGMLLYWLFRPKDFNPLLEKSRPSLVLLGPNVRDIRSGRPRQNLTLVGETPQVSPAGEVAEEAGVAPDVDRRAA
jgi:hypothetical protein